MSGFSDYREKKILEGIIAGELFVKIHKGDPGDNGTSNAATEATRKKATMGSVTTEAGVTSVKNSADLEWAEVSTTEEYTHFSIWDNVSAGNCEMTGELSAPVSMTAGNDFRMKTGKLVLKAD